MMLDFINPTSGTILFDGNPISPAIKNSISFLPEERGLYQKETIENQIPGLFTTDLQDLEDTI